MMVTDKNGNAVNYGDWLLYDGVVVRIIKIEESPKGTKAVGVYPELVGNGRVKKVTVDIAKGTLVAGGAE